VKKWINNWWISTITGKNCGGEGSTGNTSGNGWIGQRHNLK
jgi:hypothetical protein